MFWVRMLVFAGGTLVVGWVLLSAVRTVILPRGDASLLSRAVFRTSAIFFRSLAGERGSFAWRDRVMALYAPVSLIMLPGVWLTLVGVGFTAIFWAARQQGIADAWFVSGSSLLTLGFASVDTTWQQTLAFTEATMGLALVALLITFLPAMYSAFSRRETRVGLLEVRAGDPPSAEEMIVRYHRLGWLDQLAETFASWEVWFAELEESHTTYPALNFFRSPRPSRSWVTAAGAVLDAAALYASTLQCSDAARAQAGICIRAGYVSLRHIASYFGIAFDPDPQADDPISIARSEYESVYENLLDAGVPLVEDREQAWRDFAGWRVNYDTVLLALAELTMAPYAVWSSDRSTVGRQRARMKRWGPRRDKATVGD